MKHKCTSEFAFKICSLQLYYCTSTARITFIQPQCTIVRLRTTISIYSCTASPGALMSLPLFEHVAVSLCLSLSLLIGGTTSEEPSHRRGATAAVPPRISAALDITRRSGHTVALATTPPPKLLAPLQLPAQQTTPQRRC